MGRIATGAGAGGASEEYSGWKQHRQWCRGVARKTAGRAVPQRKTGAYPHLLQSPRPVRGQRINSPDCALFFQTAQAGAGLIENAWTAGIKEGYSGSVRRHLPGSPGAITSLDSEQNTMAVAIPSARHAKKRALWTTCTEAAGGDPALRPAEECSAPAVWPARLDLGYI